MSRVLSRTTDSTLADPPSRLGRLRWAGWGRGTGRLAVRERVLRAGRRLRALDRGTIRPVDVLWSMFALAMLATMALIPDAQTIPYHFIFVSFTLLYGYRMWAVRTTVALLLVLTAVPGLMFLRVYAAGSVPIDELAEIPLMPMIVGGMAYHAHRAASARRRVEELAQKEFTRLEGQREFLRDTAHAIRTPVTIARGHIELIQMDGGQTKLKEDTEEVLHQLDRLHQLARRLLVIEVLRTSDLIANESVDVRSLLDNLARRWAHAVPRDWVVRTQDCGLVRIDELRLCEAVDAMIENALRFTEPNGVIRISCYPEGPWVCVAIADSGPGIPVELRDRVFDRFFHRHPVGEEPGTGLGLALVAAVAEVFGGSCRAEAAPEGGALLTLRLPRT